MVCAPRAFSPAALAIAAAVGCGSAPFLVESAGCGPVALDGFDADEALVTVLEREGGPRSGWPGFPPRPVRFGFEPGKSSEFTDCLRTTRGIPLRDHWFNFADSGRYFHVLVAIGADAHAGAEAEAYRMLDSLRVDPRR